MAEAELEAAIADDPDWMGIPRDWHENAVPVLPGPKKPLSLRLDPDVVAFFETQARTARRA